MAAPRVLIDTNLLVLLLVGLYDPEYISRHKRTSDYSADDFQMLVMRLDGCKIVVVSNVLTEVSNLLWFTPEPHCTKIREKLKVFISEVAEVFVPANISVASEFFMPLGLTDASILFSSAEGTILTVDFDLYLQAQMTNLPSENFNHYRFS